MKLPRFSERLGSLFGRHCLRHPLRWYQHRAATFQLHVTGAENLQDLQNESCLIVSNHVAPLPTELWPLPYVPYLKDYLHSVDSFVFRRLVLDHLHVEINIVSVCGAMWVSPRKWRAWLQTNIGRPFAWGQLEAIDHCIPVETHRKADHRRFLKHFDAAVKRREPILIFPGSIDDRDCPFPIGAGAAHLARSRGLRIVPCCIIGSQFWRAGNEVTVRVGQPFSCAGMSRDAINQEIVARVTDLLNNVVGVPR